MSNWGTTTQGQDCHCSRTHSGRNNRQTKPWRNSTRLHTKPWTWEGKAPGNSTGWNLTTCKAAMLERTGAGHEPAGTQSVNCEKWSFASTHPCQTTFIILCPVFLFPAPLSSRNITDCHQFSRETPGWGRAGEPARLGKAERTRLLVPGEGKASGLLAAAFQHLKGVIQRQARLFSGAWRKATDEAENERGWDWMQENSPSLSYTHGGQGAEHTAWGGCAASILTGFQDG